MTGTTSGDSDPSVGVGSNGTVYFGYVGAGGLPGVAVSHDQGSTWQYKQTLGGNFGIKNAVFPTVVAGDDNRAAVAYLGTPTGGNYQDINTFDGVWHLYVSYTYDGGQHGVTSDATPSDPVQRGSICTGGTTCGADRNLLDFIDVTTDKQGQVLVGYADGCIDTCVTGGTNNRNAYATIARQSSGKPLFSAYDPAANLTFTSLKLAKANSSITATMAVTNNGGTSASGVQTRVLDGTRIITTTSGIALAARQTKTVTVTWKPRGSGTHTVTAIVDPLNTVAESNAIVATIPAGAAFPQGWPFPPRTTVYNFEDRGRQGTIVTAISASPFPAVLHFMNTTVVRAGFAIGDGETEAADAEAEWDGPGYHGRWAIEASASCRGETVIQVLAGPGHG